MRYITTCLFLTFVLDAQAQQLFIPSGKISFEKKVNIQRSIAGFDLPDEAKEKMQKYNISTWELYFNESASLYRQQKKQAEQTGNLFGFNIENTNELYADYHILKRILKKNIFNESFLLNDTIPRIDWKIMHDLREVAGYECRKAIGIIHDSVYVVAFYTDEILLKGGPEGFSGLPGMILGLAIPHYNTTWFATKIEPFLLPENTLKPPTAKKMDNDKELKKLMEMYGRYETGQRRNQEEIKKQIYGYTL